MIPVALIFIYNDPVTAEVPAVQGWQCARLSV